MLRFNFRYAPWKDVIEWFSEQAGLSLQADNVPQGSLNLTDTRAYTPTEALDVLNSYLLFKEYTIIRKGKSLFVIFLPDGIPPNLLEPIQPKELDARGKYEICRCVFNLNRTTPDVIAAEVEKLLGSQGSMIPLAKSQQIVITETAGTLRAIRDIIQRIDDPESISAGPIQVIELKNVSADEALAIMRKLLAIDESDQGLRTAVDSTGTKILMGGSRPDLIERAKEMIKTIESSYTSKNEALEGPTQFEVYETGTADPPTVLAVLQTLLVGIPDVRLSLDAKTGGIAALGRPANHATIRETIKQMQLSTPRVEVIPLKRLSPLSAVESIKKLYATSTVSDSTSSSSSSKTTTVSVAAPIVEADIAARQIIVKGTTTQIAEIRAFLLKLGEDGEPGKIQNNSTIRSIPLSPAASALVLDQLKEIWPKLQENQIKVVQPSAMVPSRSTTDLMPKKPEPPKAQPNSSPNTPPKAEQEAEELIDKTFESNPPRNHGPMTLFQSSTAAKYLPVQQTTQQTAVTEPAHQPVYQPIQSSEPSPSEPSQSGTDNSETEQLKRELAELKELVKQLQLQAHHIEPATIPAPAQTATPVPVKSDIVGESKPVVEQKSAAPVVVSSGPTGLMLTSDDPEALDKLEELVRMLSDETVLGKTSLVVYYLKNSTAEVVAQTLQTLLNASSSSASLGVSGTASVNSSPSLEGEQQSKILGMLTLGGSIEKTGPITVTADSRLNALLIQANPVDHKQIEKLLPILDQTDPPGGDIANRSRPHLVPMQNMRADEAVEVLEKVFASKLQGSSTGAAAGGANRGGGSNRGGNRGGGGQQTQATPQMPPMMPGMMPGGPGGPGGMIMQMMSRMQGGGSTTVKEQEQTMTLGVDSRSNSVIVNSPEALFLDVQAFLKELDMVATMQETDVQTIVLRNVGSDLASQRIKNLGGDSVQITTSRQSTTSQNRGGSFGGFGGTNTGGFFGSGGNRGTSGFGGGGGGFGNANPFLNMMRGGGFGGAGTGGGFGGNRGGGGGGFGGGNRGGGFGGR